MVILKLRSSYDGSSETAVTVTPHRRPASSAAVLQSTAGLLLSMSGAFTQAASLPCGALHERCRAKIKLMRCRCCELL